MRRDSAGSPRCRQAVNPLFSMGFNKQGVEPVPNNVRPDV
jgi:hypothetical protein